MLFSRRFSNHDGWLATLALSATLAWTSNAVPQANPRSDFSGTYLLVQQTVTVSELPVLADVVATTRAISVQRLEHSGARLRGVGMLCALWLESSSSLVETSIPDAFRRALPPVVTDARLVLDGGTVRFVQEPQISVVGARLENIATDPLPSSVSDPRVIDQDGDGKPGMTVRVSGIVSGDVYVLQRGTSSMRGSYRDGVFAGQIRFHTEQHILGASSRLLESGPSARPDFARSRFWLVPAKANLSCKEALQLSQRWH